MKTESCRICKKNELSLILDYGNVALADSFLSSEKEIYNEKKYSLRFCICNNCKHLQIDEIVDPSLLFENYIWETGVSKSIIEFSQELYNKVTSFYNLIPYKKSPKVLEVASNDGAILSVFKKNGCEILGVDPAKNIVDKANEMGIRSIAEFFNSETAKSITEEYGKWDVCIARNVLAHVKEIHSFVEAIKIILGKEGFVVIEVPHLKTMFEELQYDQIFHEHIGYHSLDSIKKLFEMYEMEVFDVEEIWIHGGSIRVYLQHKNGPRKIIENVSRILDIERNLGLYEESSWKEFANRAIAHKKALKGKLEELKSNNKKIAIYGASGKGQSLLQFCEIDNKLIDYVVDKSKMKQDKFTPGTHMKIFSPSQIYENKPDVILLCAWNFAKEIMTQEEKFTSLGGKFLHPFPLPHYLK